MYTYAKISFTMSHYLRNFLFLWVDDFELYMYSLKINKLWFMVYGL